MWEAMNGFHNRTQYLKLKAFAFKKCCFVIAVVIIPREIMSKSFLVLFTVNLKAKAFS